jgi:hypothetical protein
VLGLPVVHLDTHDDGPGWRPAAPADWVARHRRLVAGERWVLDGNDAGTLPARLDRADMVVSWICRRCCAPGRSSRGGRSAACGPRSTCPLGLRPKLDPQFLAYVLGFRRPALLAKLARCSQDRAVVVLGSRRAVRRFLAELAGRGRDVPRDGPGG